MYFVKIRGSLTLKVTEVTTAPERKVQLNGIQGVAGNGPMLSFSTGNDSTEVNLANVVAVLRIVDEHKSTQIYKAPGNLWMSSTEANDKAMGRLAEALQV